GRGPGVPAHDAAVAVQDAAGDRPDPRQERERGALAAEVLEEARGEGDREG
ncbi:MAG: LSU ribosomal protein L22p (L17e), partial [uncultured Gemmatimonadaceae bacterium]